MRTDDPVSATVPIDAQSRRPALRGPQDIQEARLRDAVGRLQVLLLRDLVAQFEADERDSEMRSDHRGWLEEDTLVTRALGIYGPGAEIAPSERALVIGVLEDLRFQRFLDRLDVGSGQRRAWRLRRQTDDVVDLATRFVDEHKWVPPVIDVTGVIQAVSTITSRDVPRGLPSPKVNRELTVD